MSAEKNDHKAEALRRLEEADEVRCGHDSLAGEAVIERVRQLQSEALVHSNLAIAEGQERVAEAIADAFGDDSKLDLLLRAVRALEPSS